MSYDVRVWSRDAIADADLFPGSAGWTAHAGSFVFSEGARWQIVVEVSAVEPEDVPSEIGDELLGVGRVADLRSRRSTRQSPRARSAGRSRENAERVRSKVELGAPHQCNNRRSADLDRAADRAGWPRIDDLSLRLPVRHREERRSLHRSFFEVSGRLEV